MFSIQESPFSDETKTLRRNSVASSAICLFIGLTEKLPEKFSLLGITFTSNQQEVVSWFVLGATFYFFMHFFSVASIEIARWLQPLFERKFRQDVLLSRYSHAFDESDFANIPDQIDEQDMNAMIKDANEEAEYLSKKRLRLLFGMVYLRLSIEIILPIIFALWGMYELVCLIMKV